MFAVYPIITADPVCSHVSVSLEIYDILRFCYAGTEMDYSTIRRKKPLGMTAGVMSPLVIDSSRSVPPIGEITPTDEKIVEMPKKPVDEEAAIEEADRGDEDSEVSTEDGITLSFTESDGEADLVDDDDQEQKVPVGPSEVSGSWKTY